MSPILSFEWLGLPWRFHAYGFFMAAALITLVSAGVGISLPRALASMVLTAVCVPLGARIWYALSAGRDFSAFIILLMEPHLKGFTIAGGLVLSILVGAASSRLMKIPFYQRQDAASPALFASIALFRIGCFLNGCCFGIKSDLPWAVRFPKGSMAHLYYLTSEGRSDALDLRFLSGPPPVHPTQLYELAGAILAAMTSHMLLKKKLSSGVPYLSGAVVYTATRLVTQFFRAPASGVSAYVNQTNLFIFSVLLLMALFLLRRATKSGKQTYHALSELSRSTNNTI